MQIGPPKCLQAFGGYPLSARGGPAFGGSYGGDMLYNFSRRARRSVKGSSVIERSSSRN